MIRYVRRDTGNAMLPITPCFLFVAVLTAPPSSTPNTGHVLVVKSLRRPFAGWEAAAVWRAAARDKEGRITVSVPVASGAIDAKEFQRKKGWLVLKDPDPQVTPETA